MILYHFTSHAHIGFIREEGITVGDTALTPFGKSRNAVFLTADPDPKRQGWSKGSRVCKTAIRLKVEVPVSPDLLPWAVYARKHGMKRSWFDRINSVQPGWENHYVYDAPGGVPPAWIVSEEILAPRERFLEGVTVRRFKTEMGIQGMELLPAVGR